MPIEAVQQFLTQVQSDQSLQEELKQALETENKREAVTELAQTKGYSFSPDEIFAEVQKRQNEFQAKKEAGELSDEELEAVAGGATPLITVTLMISAPVTGAVLSNQLGDDPW